MVKKDSTSISIPIHILVRAGFVILLFFVA